MSTANGQTRGFNVGLAAMLVGLVLAVYGAVITAYNQFKREVLLTQAQLFRVGPVHAMDRLADRWVPDFSNSGVRARAHQSSQVITGLVIVITVSVAVIIVSSFNSSLGGVENTELSNAQQNVLSSFADMVNLIGPLLLIIIAVVIVAYVQKMRAG
jgi:hypothetical protein